MSEGRMQMVVVSSLTMTIIGALDGLADTAKGTMAIATRAGWKTLLSALGIYLNVINFRRGGQYENKTHLALYLSGLIGAGTYAMYTTK